MSEAQKRKSETRTVKRYKPPPAHGPPEYSVEVICPICGHRVFDLSIQPSELLWVSLKCPTCRKIVDVQCSPLGAAHN